VAKEAALTSNGNGQLKAAGEGDLIVAYARHAADATEAVVRVVAEVAN
jgi:hypothetical protein